MKFDAYGSMNMLHLIMPFISIFFLCGFIRAPIFPPRMLYGFIYSHRCTKPLSSSVTGIPRTMYEACI